MNADIYTHSLGVQVFTHIYTNMDVQTQGKLKALNTSALIILNY